MRALLVDDEPLARREMRRLLSATPWIEIVGEAGDIVDAEESVVSLAPDLLFLDIRMPGGSGFDLLARLERVPQVIFTTAFDQYAVRAFEVHALDYLLKPVDPARLADALARVRRPEAPASSDAPLERLFIKDGEASWLVRLDEVRLLAADGNYVHVHWGARDLLLARSLAALEPKLDARRFFRANRAQIIHLDYVESIDTGVGGRLHVQLRGGPEVEVSRRQARLLRQRLGA